MAKSTYILLVTLTDKGKANFRQSYTANREKFKKDVEAAGGKVTGYVTTGHIDAVEVLEMPDDEKALKVLLARVPVPEINVTTLKAFPEEMVKNAFKSL